MVQEYVHSHLAVNLVPPSEIDPDIPELFSQIIAKLAHKSPDMRYQSASGLRSDLQACIKRVESLRSSRSDLDLSNLDNTTVIFSLNTFDYKIGCKDLPDKLKYPMAVGWRDAEKQRLIDIFQKLHVGVSKKEICVITGAFGQGRSSLASQLQSHVTSNHGVFGELEEGWLGER